MEAAYSSAHDEPKHVAQDPPEATQGASAGMPLYMLYAGVSQPGDRFEEEANRLADEVVRDERVQRRLDQHLGSVEVHIGPDATREADQLGARAFTHDGEVYFGQGQFQPETPSGRWLMAHELAHVAQQKSTPPGATPTVQRAVVAHPPPTPEAVGLPSGDQAARDEKKMTGYLAGQSLKMLDLQNELIAANPQTPEEREALRGKLERMVRLNAIGLMASHRASIEGARDRLLSKERREQVKADPGASKGSAFEDMRKAAKFVTALNDAKEKLERYRLHLHFAHSDTLFRRGKVGDVLEAIAENGAEYMTEDQRRPIRESFGIAQKNGTVDDYWLFAYGATNFLLKWREDQIFGVEQSINQVHEKYPLFASLDPADIAHGKFSSDKALLEAAEEAYKDVLAKVDVAISDIARGEIHPFDMAKAVEVTRIWMPEPVKKALDEAIQDRQVTKFWLTMGLTLLETALMFIPVVGPIVAVSIGVGMVTNQLDDMLTRLAVAKASTTPYGDGPVGVQSPDALEWVMLGVSAVLTAFGALGVWRSIRMAGGPIEPPPELLQQIGEPSEVNINRPSEHPYQNPPNMTRLRGQPLEFAKLNASETYLWVIDADGNFIVAPENQLEAGFASQRPGAGVVKHGDLTPGPSGTSRGAARAGGELKAELGPNGQPTGKWIMDNNSSYTFQRVGGETLSPESLDASRDLLELYGTDTSKIVTRDVVPR